uniref:Antibiotic efflux pump outer membrane protein ArpC-like n=1 Tax=Drosophila rhopaloa TaxID=1041015 RepID=A0A6P4FRP2_DRORH
PGRRHRRRPRRSPTSPAQPGKGWNVKRFILAASTALALAGCTVGPDFKSPIAEQPVTFGSTRPDVRSTTYGGAMEEAWWKSFHDHELDTLMDRLARQNLDLQAAMERVTQARARFRLTRAESLPQLDASFSYTRNHLSQNGIVSLLQPAPGASLTYNQFDPKLTASWEVDLFGRVRRLTEAARAGVQVSEEDRNAIALSVSTELAETYFRYRETRALEALTLKNAALAERRLALVDGLVRYGAAPALSDAQARAQLSRIRQALPALRARQNELANAIALLLDAPPRSLEGELERDAALQPDVPHLVAVGLPADVIRRRPDVRRSEAQLHMATASTGAAVASFYPDITFSS